MATIDLSRFIFHLQNLGSDASTIQENQGILLPDSQQHTMFFTHGKRVLTDDTHDQQIHNIEPPQKTEPWQGLIQIDLPHAGKHVPQQEVTKLLQGYLVTLQPTRNMDDSGSICFAKLWTTLIYAQACRIRPDVSIMSPIYTIFTKR